MTIKFTVALFVFWGVALCLRAGDFYPPPPTNAIILNFSSGIPQTTKGSFREDFWRCLTPAAIESVATKSD